MLSTPIEGIVMLMSKRFHPARTSLIRTTSHLHCDYAAEKRRTVMVGSLTKLNDRTPSPNNTFRQRGEL